VSKPRLAVETRHVPPYAPSSTIGIDLASQPALTAAARIEWTAGCGRLTFLDAALDDGALVALARGDRVTKAAIDAPFGWPRGVRRRCEQLQPHRQVAGRRGRESRLS